MCVRFVLVLSSVLMFTSCETMPKNTSFEVTEGHRTVYKRLDEYFSTCYPKKNFRKNLYTDIPLGEIVLSELGKSFVPLLDGQAGAQETLNISIDGRKRKGSLITVSPFKAKGLVFYVVGGGVNCNKYKL